MRKEEFKKAEKFSEVAEKIFDSLLKIKFYDKRIAELTAPPKLDCDLSVAVGMIIWLGFFAFALGAISIVLIIACYIVQFSEATKYIWRIDLVIFSILVLCGIMIIIMDIVRAYKECKPKREEFFANQEKYKKDALTIQQEREEKEKKVTKLLKEFRKMCDEYSIPTEERKSYNFIGLAYWAENMPDITFELCLKRYLIIKPYAVRKRLQEDEDKLNQILKSNEDFNKKYEEDKQRETMMKLYGQETEPDIDAPYTCGESTFYYKGLNFTGSMLMDDEDGHTIEVRNIEGFLIDVNSGKLVDRI